ncbi:virulence RhuM family protein [Capnocytophaga sputigena]|uniref:virulence RhuM family protein n=1 Tax=Capnocytophaga sputigena TaxID=1019 RepID=UPI0028D60FDC|nr:virulence RhuM family protein [Capnocytophaga sputigena]
MKEIIQGELLLYQDEKGSTQIEVRLENENVWLTQAQLVTLYQSSKANVSEHIKHIFEEGELEEMATVRKFRTVQKEGSREVTRDVVHYNLDLIISLGYRIKSHIATKFRIWATQRLKEYIIKGFVIDDNRLKQNAGGNYWYELLNRIRDIRSSEKVLYRQVLDLYATSVDYDPRTPESIRFFKIVQNKLHYAAHGHTAAEVIYERADSDKPFMGLTVFAGDHPSLKEVVIAKNYLTEEELKVLNNLVSGYFDFAEIQAMKRKPMYMADYIKQLDNILSATGEQVLQNAGKVTHQEAIEKATTEFKKYQVKTLSAVEQDYLKTLKSLEKKLTN